MVITRVARILSLDVVLGACIGSWFVAEVARTSLNGVSLMALAVCVWLIYTADHLRDAFCLTHEAHTPRHRFHQVYFRTIFWVFVLIAGLGGLLLFYLPPSVLQWGLGLLGLVIIYFLVSQLVPVQRIFPKELMIAFLYACGIFLPVVTTIGTIPLRLYVLFGQYIALALINLIIFSWYEYESDRMDRSHSLVTRYGKRKSKRLLFFCIVCTILSVVISGVVFSDQPLFLPAQLLILLMVSLLALILYRPRFFGRYERYRWFGDSVFMLPLLMFPFLV